MANFELYFNSKLFSMYFLYMDYLFLPHLEMCDLEFELGNGALFESLHILNIHYHAKFILCDSLPYVWSWTKPNS